MASTRLQELPDEINDLSRVVLDCAIKVHKVLGPGLLEGSYRICLAHELKSRGYKVESEVAVPIKYEGILLETGYRLDLLVNDALVVELKAVDAVLAVHQAQLLSYLKHTGSVWVC
jgi:GxxExxY protein